MMLIFWLPATVLPSLTMLPIVTLTGLLCTSPHANSVCTFASDLE